MECTPKTQRDKKKRTHEKRVSTTVPRDALGKVATIPRHAFMSSILLLVRVEGYAVLPWRVDADTVIGEAPCWMQVEEEEEGSTFEGNDLVILVLCRDPRLQLVENGLRGERERAG